MGWIVLLGVAAVVVILAAVVADGYYQAYKAYKDASGTTSALNRVRSEFAKGKVPSEEQLAQATRPAVLAERRLASARFTLRLTGDIPLLGLPVRAVQRGVAAAGEEARAASTVRGMALALLGPSAAEGTGQVVQAPVFHDGRVNVRLLQSMAPRVDALIRQLRAADASIRAIPSVPFVHRVQSLKAKALAESAQAIRLAERARAALGVLPSFLGANGPRTYFVALQNNADQRGTGGAVLGYALLHANAGRISLEGGGPINNIDNQLTGIRVPLPSGVAWYVRNAHVNPRINNGANYSPNFPEVAATWAAMVRRSTGVRVSGAIAIDPRGVAFGLLHQAPISVPAFPGPISAHDVVPATEHRQYTLPHSQQVVFPSQLVAAAFERFVHPTDMTGLMRRIGTAFAEKRIQLWSANQAEQTYFERLGWSGALSHNPGDYLYLAENKRIASKVDYFAHQSINYDVRVTSSGAVRSTYSVTLSSKVPPGQGRGVAGTWSPYGLNLAMMNLYVPRRARFVAVTPSGPFLRSIQPWSRVAHVRPAGFVQHTEGAFRVFTQTIAAWPQHPTRLTFRYTTQGVIRHTAAGEVYELTVQHQPMTNAATITVTLHLPNGATVRTADTGWQVRGGSATFRATLTRDVVTRIVF